MKGASTMIVWQRCDKTAFEFFRWVDEKELVMHGKVVGDIDGIPGYVRYRVRVGPDGRLTARVYLQSHLGLQRLKMVRSQPGHWRIDDVDRPDLVSAIDIDMGITPATNTLPIRRMQLAVGESRELVAAWVQFPSLRVSPVRQRYCRMDKWRYMYESLDTGYHAEITVQADDMVWQYADVWCTVSGGAGMSKGC